MQPKLKRKQKNAEARLYCSRSQAMKRLGVTLSDFRRICILKGVFPRVPKATLRGRDKVYYHLKDIRHLAHEPILQKFHEQKILTRRMHQALTKLDPAKAKLINQELQNARDMDLSELLLERYPSLIDAIRDMDDALSLVTLFASCAANNESTIDGAALADCRKLTDEWMTFVTATGCLTKTFISIKGIYYEVEILDQKIVWLMPHEFSNADVADIDFKVMSTFLLLYRRLIKFVMYKLYLLAGLQYPPTNVTAKAAARANRFLSLEVTKVDEKPANVISSDGTEVTLQKNSAEALKRRSLFRNQVFYLNRETPIFHLAFLLRSCGASCVGFDEVSPLSDRVSPITATDLRITHHIVDRPPLAFEKLKEQLGSDIVSSRSFIQPQWVFDCVNANAILPMNPYAQGVQCPPHLSPFGDDLGHVPEHTQVLQTWSSLSTNIDQAEQSDAAESEQEKSDADKTQQERLESSTAADENDIEKPSVEMITPQSRSEIERARMLLTSKKRTLYKKLRSKEIVRERESKNLKAKSKKSVSSK